MPSATTGAPNDRIFATDPTPWPGCIPARLDSETGRYGCWLRREEEGRAWRVWEVVVVILHNDKVVFDKVRVTDPEARSIEQGRQTSSSIFAGRDGVGRDGGEKPSWRLGRCLISSQLFFAALRADPGQDASLRDQIPACANCLRKNVECLPRGNGGACQSCWQGKTRCSLLKKDATGEPGPIDAVSSPNAEASSSRKRRRDSMASDANTRSDRWKVTLGERLEEDKNPPTKFQQRQKKQMKGKKRERETVQPLSKNAFRRQTSPDPLPDTMPLPPAPVPAGNARETALEAQMSALKKTIGSLMRMVEVLWKDGKEDEVTGLERDLSMAQLASTSRDPSIPTLSAAKGGRNDSCGNSPSIPLWNAIREESLESSDEMDVSD
ncbi:hypothetical protein BU15DRAFT_69481 [Melanogaster broomeanus]|nr:hypothetical protein BU15DRAFT_69481 [Melanogaster broomeanus]